MGICVKRLEINKFRGIKDLELSEFNHINIFTGDNNSGKTSVLEVLTTIGRPDYFVSLFNMVQTHKRGSLFDDILGIFPLDSDCIEYNYNDKSDNMHNVAFFKKDIQVQLPEREKLRLQGFLKTGSQKEVDEKLVNAHGMEITINSDEKDIKHTVYDFQRMYSVYKHEADFPIFFVSSAAHTKKIDLEDLIKDNRLYNELLTVLRNFDKTISDIFISDDECFLRSNLYEYAVPLALYGDGLKKALFILADLIKSKNGILLMDEFETAIHTSVMENVFSLILKTAEAYNVQIFMTSHSKEAIEKVLKCAGYSENINLYTLYKMDGKNYARKLSCNEALDLYEKGMELRG